MIDCASFQAQAANCVAGFPPHLLVRNARDISQKRIIKKEFGQEEKSSAKKYKVITLEMKFETNIELENK